ncbi:hypothetical protein [Flexivirga caeni]|uniref:Uncharacterized protein n=1 Tax=Flexivirga caeni TaxID=2294115 RepID=A0A3M9MJ13_9MICO|nr:hypothetical protein [Flexivirga caeni]RNI25494.1 hypothetical protein EFY87_00435 [Flexivirga caeni]
MNSFIDDVHDLVSAQLASFPAPLAIRLDVGLPDSIELLARHDLDNYLYPLVPQLTKRTGQPFVSVWASKAHSDRSTVGVETAIPTADPGGQRSFDVVITKAGGTAAYKEQIRDQIAATTPLSEGAVELQLAFVTGPGRAWPNLWKATIDALGPILGRDDGASEWNNRDGRITMLGLHHVVDASQGHSVRLGIRASAVS